MVQNNNLLVSTEKEICQVEHLIELNDSMPTRTAPWIITLSSKLEGELWTLAVCLLMYTDICLYSCTFKQTRAIRVPKYAYVHCEQ